MVPWIPIQFREPNNKNNPRLAAFRRFWIWDLKSTLSVSKYCWLSHDPCGPARNFLVTALRLLNDCIFFMSVTSSIHLALKLLIRKQLMIPETISLIQCKRNVNYTSSDVTYSPANQSVDVKCDKRPDPVLVQISQREPCEERRLWT